MTGEEVKQQVIEALWSSEMDVCYAREALAPCVVLTAEEREQVKRALVRVEGDDHYAQTTAALALLTPPEGDLFSRQNPDLGPLASSVPADRLADVQEEMADKALRVYGDLWDIGPPAPGEGDDLPRPEQGMKC